MLTKAKKHGNSISVNMPIAFARTLNIKPGSSLDIDMADGNIIILY